MKTFIRSLAVAATLAAGAHAYAAQAASSGAMQACEAGSFTQHGIWDCR